MRRFAILFCLFYVLSFFPAALSAQPVSSTTYYERGKSQMAEENWYSAVESFLECVRINPAHAEGTASLAECYYELAEFDEALNG